MKHRYLFLCLIFLRLLFSCSPSKKLVQPTVGPMAPVSLPALPQSEIDMVLKVPASYLLAKLDSMVPKQFTSDTWPNYIQPSCDFRYKYRFLRSGLTISCSNNHISIKLTGSYQISGGRCLCAADKPVSPWVSGSCGFGNEPMRRVNISINSQLMVGPNYHLTTTTKTDRLEALDRCSVSVFSTDVTQQVLDSIRSSLAGFCSTLDQTIASMDFKSMAEPILEKSFGKTAISKYGYLSINPSTLRIGKLNYIRDTFSISAGVSCRPALSSDSANNNSLFVMPPLQSTENKNGVSLYMDALYNYTFLSKLLNDTLYNRAFDIKGRTIVIKKVSMESAGNQQLEFKIVFAGSNKGTIYLRGTPILDTAKQSLTIPDLSYSLENADLVLKIAKSLFRNKIRETINGKTYLDIGALVKSNLPMLDSMLNRRLTSTVFTAGKINQLKLIGLLATKDALEVQVYTNAVLSLTDADKPPKGANRF